MCFSCCLHGRRNGVVRASCFLSIRKSSKGSKKRVILYLYMFNGIHAYMHSCLKYLRTMIFTAAICFACPVAQQSGGEAPLQLGERSFFCRIRSKLSSMSIASTGRLAFWGRCPFIARRAVLFCAVCSQRLRFIIVAHLDSHDYTRQTCV